jgi:FixJ family two-component response regulator
LAQHSNLFCGPQLKIAHENRRSYVFVVDNDSSMREALTDLITYIGLSVEAFKSAREFLEHRRPDASACLVLDVRLPGLIGLDLQRELVRTEAPIPIIFITGHADIPMAVRAIKEGAVEFLGQAIS